MTHGASTCSWHGGRAVRLRGGGSPSASFLGHFTVFALAVVVGYYVICNVAHALHTPLMTETNAISGIILVGAPAPGRLGRRSAARKVDHGARLAVAASGQHQHLRWVPRDPPHARRCSGRTEADDDPRTSIQAAYIVAAACSSSCRSPGCRSTRPPATATSSAWPAWASPSSPPLVGSTAGATPLVGLLLIVVAMAIGGSHRLVAGPRRRDDRHARARRDAALVRRPRGGARRHQLVPRPTATAPRRRVHLVEVFLGVFIGAVTFTGSIVAFLKLAARIRVLAADAARPALAQPRRARRVRRPAGVVRGSRTRSCPLLVMTVIALAFGWHLVASIGGGDMPVVVSMLNSYSGWAAAAAGFMLGNDLLIVTGALVGSSGAILSYIMCKAMNRSFVSVIAGGFGSDGAVGDDKSTTASTARRSRRRSPTCSRTPRRSSSPRLRHGGRAGAVPRRRADRQAAGARRQRPLRHPPGRRPPARAHERAARRGQACPTTSSSRWTRSTTTSPTPTSCSSSAPTTPSTRRPPRTPAPDRRHAGPGGVERQGRRRLQALDERRLRRSAEPAVLQARISQMLFGDAKERVEDIIKAL